MDGQTGRRAGGQLVAMAMLLLVACGEAGWKDAYTRLAGADQAARAAGYRPLAGPRATFGVFSRAGSERWRVHLEAHRSYFIAGACTTGCDTLDFDVAEPHGTAVGQDTTTGPTPRLVLTTGEEGDFVVTFRWGSCRTDRCRWVAQVYAKPDSSP